MYTTIREEWLAEGIAKGRAEGMAKGRAKGKAQMLERLLDTRGLPLSPELRARIRGCDDEAILQRWFDRAVTAATVAEVFDD